MQRGNLYVIARVCVPEQINERQRELYEQLLAAQPECSVADCQQAERLAADS